MSSLPALAKAGDDSVALAFQGDCELELCKQFVAWMREHDCCGWYAAIEIDEALEMFCDGQGLEPPPRDRARTLLLQVPGVKRKRQRLTGPAFRRVAKVTGLERATLYWLPKTPKPLTFPGMARGWPGAGQGPGRGRAEAGQRPDRDRAEAKGGPDHGRPGDDQEPTGRSGCADEHVRRPVARGSVPTVQARPVRAAAGSR